MPQILFRNLMIRASLRVMKLTDWLRVLNKHLINHLYRDESDQAHV